MLSVLQDKFQHYQPLPNSNSNLILAPKGLKTQLHDSPWEKFKDPCYQVKKEIKYSNTKMVVNTKNIGKTICKFLAGQLAIDIHSGSLCFFVIIANDIGRRKISCTTAY